MDVASKICSHYALAWYYDTLETNHVSAKECPLNSLILSMPICIRNAFSMSPTIATLWRQKQTRMSKIDWPNIGQYRGIQERALQSLPMHHTLSSILWWSCPVTQCHGEADSGYDPKASLVDLAPLLSFLAPSLLHHSERVVQKFVSTIAKD